MLSDRRIKSSYFYGLAQGRHSGDAAQAAQELRHLALQMPILRDLWPQHHLGAQRFSLVAEGLSFVLKLCND